jgi:hypothetical protein
MLGSNFSVDKSALVAKQLRDKNGRWIEMGGLVKWYTSGIGETVGKVLDTQNNDTVSVEITSEADKGKTVTVPAGNLEAVKAKADLDVSAPASQVPNKSEEEEDNIDSFYTKITSPYNVTDSAFKNFSGYTAEEEYALQSYVYDFQGINQPLRAERSYKSSSHNGLMNILNKSVLTEPVTVWRGLFADNNVLSKLQKDSIYFDKAFTSTSSNKQVATDRINTYGSKEKKPVTLQINLPIGFKAHKFDYTINNSNRIERFADEEEVLLPPEVPFRVISMEPNADGTGYHAIVEPILTKDNSSGVTTNDEIAAELTEKAKQPTPRKKKWGLFSLSAAELSIGSSLVSNNGIIITKVTDELWEYKTATSKISYNNNSIDSFKSIDPFNLTVEEL